MDDIPNKLSDWNLETIRDLVNNHAYEPGIFDFKEVLVGTNSGHKANLNESIAKTVCSMANSEGGFLIFGVADGKGSHSGAEDRIVGIPLSGEHRKEFGEKLKQVQPPVHFDAIPAPIPGGAGSALGVFVVHVPLSTRRPHALRDGDKWVFYRRGQGGSAESMDYYQVRDQMLVTEERLRQVNLLRLKLAQFRQQCADLLARDGLDLLDYFDRFETDGFEALLAVVCPLLPSGKLLEVDLLKIPPKAQALNRLLDRWHHDFGIGHQIRSRNLTFVVPWTNQIHGEARIIDEISGKSILALHAEFGPIN